MKHSNKHYWRMVTALTNSTTIVYAKLDTNRYLIEIAYVTEDMYKPSEYYYNTIVAADTLHENIAIIRQAVGKDMFERCQFIDLNQIEYDMLIDIIRIKAQPKIGKNTLSKRNLPYDTTTPIK